MKTLAVVIGCLVLSGVTIAAVMAAMYCIGAAVIHAVRGPAIEPPQGIQ